MARFSRGEYAAAAEAYRARYEGGIRAALAQYGPVSLAQQLLDAAADACQRAGLLSRRVRRMDIRTVIAVYLNPLCWLPKMRGAHSWRQSCAVCGDRNGPERAMR